jgi:hypothetical protein
MHIIRLRAPWQVEPLERGATRVGRNFNRPTNLGAERVWLVVVLQQSSARVRVNDVELGDVDAVSPGRFDITPLLADHNRVEIDVKPPRASDVPGDVRLEIEE